MYRYKLSRVQIRCAPDPSQAQNDAILEGTEVFLIHARRLICLLLLSTLFTGSVLAQKRPRADSDYERPQTPAAPTLPAQLLQQLATIRDAALADDYAYQQVAHLTENIGPRPVGSPQAQAAIEYVAAEMRKLGLEVRLEPVQGRHWIRGAESAELVEYPGQAPGTTQKIVLTALGGNHPTPPEGITAEVIVANNFADLDRLGRQNVAGKIVLFNVPSTNRRPTTAMPVKLTTKRWFIVRWEPGRRPSWAPWVRWSGQSEAPTIVCRIREEAALPTFQPEP